MPDTPPSVRDQLIALLDETGLSQRELAKRMTAAEGVPDDKFAGRWKSILRWLGKVTTEDEENRVERPTDKSLLAIEVAAERPGYFKVPSRAQRRATGRTELQDTRRRLAALEKRFDDFVEATVARLASLEEPPAQQAQR